KSVEFSSSEVEKNEVEHIETSALKVYPNPFSDWIKFEFESPEDTNVRIDIYDVSGRKVQTIFENSVEGGLSYDVQFIPRDRVSEIYIYKMKLGNEVYSGKLIYKRH
ncbi:T9SS type A sorting domain-containing protein, partial [Draconibacterium sediminis]